MTARTDWKMWLAFLVVVHINVIFGYKYLSRYTDWAVVPVSLILAFQYIIFAIRDHTFLRSSIYFLPRLGIFSLFAFTAFIHIYFPVQELNVDRWSVISSFWEEAFAGRYPYFAKSHMANPPGPLPLYFILALPFYYLGELALLSVLGYILWFNRKVLKSDYWIVLLLLSSLFMYWEILTRSNIFTNTTLVLLLLIGMGNELHKKGRLSLWWAVPAGLLLSTRSIIALAYIPFLLFYLRNGAISFSRLVLFTALCLLVLASTLLPFLLLFPEELTQLNPFTIQSTFLMPQVYGLLFIVMAMVLGFAIRKEAEIYLAVGITLFISMAVYGVYHIATRGFQVAYLESSMDISYFIFSVPFLLHYLHRTDPQQ